MAIPDYQDLMLPLLRATADGAVYTLKELDAVLTRQFSLTQEDLFERVVVELLQKMGYGGSFAEAAEVLGGSGDAGLDGVIKQDRLGLEAVYVQAKRWENTVGRPTVQGFAGSLQGQRARKGVLMTTASFSREAQDFVNSIDMKIVLIDGLQLVELMIEHDIGVSTEELVKVKRMDLGYFDEE